MLMSTWGRTTADATTSQTRLPDRVIGRFHVSLCVIICGACSRCLYTIFTEVSERSVERNCAE